VNRLYFGDNLAVLKKHVKDESVDLIYLDPPFNSKAAYNVLYKSPVGGDAQVKAFEDTWSWEKDGAAIALDELREDDLTTFNMLRSLQVFLGQSDLMAYLAMMAVRLVQLRRVLKPTGSIYLHCDPTAAHYLKMVMDAIFGAESFVNHITWKRSHAHSDGAQGSKHFGRNTDIILFYSRSPERTWNIQYAPYSQEYLDRDYRRLDEDGRRYRLDNIQGPGGAAKGNPYYEVLGVSRHWRYSKERMEKLLAEGTIIQTRPGAVPQLKRYLDEMPGVPAQEIWTDIPIINNRTREALGYPTQKPLALLQRIVRASSNEGDTVLDPFCGCGTAIHAAETLNRNWIGIDITYLAIQVIEDRFKTWLPAAKYKIDGIPSDELSARKLAARDHYTFQQWAIGRLGGQSRGKGADGGIDGEIAFMKGANDYGRALVSVKAGGTKPDDVRALLGVVDLEGADLGILVCLDPTSGMREKANATGRVQLFSGSRPRIQIISVKDLVDGPNIGIVTQLNTITAAQAARSVARRQPPKRPTAEELRQEPPLPPMPLQGGKAKAAQAPLPLDEPLLAQPQVPKRRRS
jgi:site-specific DNA-methyltransferase (adenine-specific)